MKNYIEERATEIAEYIIENNATVRQAAKHFGISKRTVNAVVTKYIDRNATCKPVKCGGHFYCKKHQKTAPVVGCFI